MVHHRLHDSTPAPAGLAHSARRRARRVARWPCAGRADQNFRSPRRSAASPPTCRRSSRTRRMTSPPATAGPCAPAISSARRPIRRCRSRHRRSGSKPATPCRRPATACSIPIRSISQARWFRCWRRRYRGRGFAGRAAISPAEPLVVEAGRRILPRDLLIARAAGCRRSSVRRPRVRIVNIPATRRGGDGAADRGERAQGRGRCRPASRPRHAMRRPLPKRSMPAAATCCSRSAAAASAAPMRP